MSTIENIQNYGKFTEFIDKLPVKGPDVYFFFSGAKYDDGHNWCSWCEVAEPMVRKYVSELKKDIIFAFVDAGDNISWTDNTNPFRTDHRLNLIVIPTIIRWKGVQRLEGLQCTKRELVQMLFEDEE